MKRCVVCCQNLMPAFVKDGYEIEQCSGCGLFRVKLDEPYQKMVKRYYSRGFYCGSKNRIAYANYLDDAEIDAENFKYFLKIITNYKKGGKFLDIGCATGGFLELAQERGFEVFGNDVSNFATKIAKKKLGKAIKQGDFARVRYRNNFFDVVTLIDVIEHLERPDAAIKKIHRIMKPGGVMLLTTGDADSLPARLLGKAWYFFIPPQHLWAFGRNNLSQLLQEAGFEVIKIKLVGRAISLRHLMHQARTIYPNFVFDAAYKLAKSSFLGKINLKVNLFSTMMMVARKR